MKYIFFLIFLPFTAWTQVNIPTSGKEKHQAFELQKKRIAASPYKNLQWRLTGPDNKSGRATDVAGITGNTNVLYAAFATGGVWKTENGGENWFPIFDQQGTLSIGTLGLSPSNNNILYVGTGEANILRASLPGMGIYKSINAGKSFEFLGLENTGTIARIIVHPTNPQIVYVAASGNEWTYNQDRGLYKTIDGGKTWKKILFESEKSGCIDVVLDPQNPNIVYASMWNRIRKRYSDPMPEEGDHLYKSIDGGNSWKQMGKGLPDTKLTGRIGLAVSESDPNFIYAFVDDHNKKRDPLPGETDSYERKVQKVVIGGAIYRSRNKGEDWEKMGEVHDFFKPFSGTYGWVFSQIRVHPKNKDLIYVLGVAMGKSEDGGKTWKQFMPMDTASEDIHGDNHALWFDKKNPNRMLLGNDGGVSITMDGGNIWNNFFDKIPTTQFYTVTYDLATPFNIYGAVQDEGSMSGNERNEFGKPISNNPRSWRMAPGGEGTQIQVDPVDTKWVYASSYYGRLMKTDYTDTEHPNYQRFNDFAVGAIDSLRGEWLAGTLLSKFNRNFVYHGLQHLYQTKDGGDHWNKISPDLSYNDTIHRGRYPYLIYHQAITTIAEGQKQGELYVGTDDGRVWSTLNDGATWNEITAGLPANFHIAKITTSDKVANRIYVVLNGRRMDQHQPMIYQSNDQGKHWIPIQGDLPASPVNVIIENINGDLLIGTDMGVYISKNLGVNWICLNANLPTAVSVNDMFIHPRDHKLVLGTYGRGVYILDDISILK